MATVTVERLSKSYSPRAQVVREVSFNVADRAFLTLLGPSGCGKSTILRMIAGLDEVSGGEIRIDGEPITNRAPAERDIAMVFQSYALYPHMSCYENMAVSLRLRRLPEAEIKQRVQAAAELLGVTALLDRLPKQLSGGQRQRIALGRAIVRQPKVMLLDEPLSNLDAQLREHMRTELKKLFVEMGVTVIYVTHDQSEAMSMSDTIVVLKEGVLQQQGSPREIYVAPANTFVASFLGSPRINLIEGRSEPGRFTAGPIQLSLNGGRKIVARTLLGARPEHISVLTSEQENGVAARIELVEPLGLHAKIVVRAGDHLLSALSDNDSLKPGQHIWLDFDADKMLYFDAESGQAL